MRVTNTSHVSLGFMFVYSKTPLHLHNDTTVMIISKSYKLGDQLSISTAVAFLIESVHVECICLSTIMSIVRIGK